MQKEKIQMQCTYESISNQMRLETKILYIINMIMCSINLYKLLDSICSFITMQHVFKLQI